MKKKPPKKTRIMTYLEPDTWKATRRLAFEREVPIYQVIESALKKCIPEKYWPEKD